MAHDTAHAAHDDAHGDEHHPHVVPFKTYFAVFAALLALTILTVAASYVNLGSWNLVVALVIATMKASLVAAIFMHMFYDNKFNVIVLVAGLIFLGIFIGITRTDSFGRRSEGRVDNIRVTHLADPFGPDAQGPLPPPAETKP